MLPFNDAPEGSPHHVPVQALQLHTVTCRGPIIPPIMHAGRYMQGEEPPYPPVTRDIKKDFQAVGDGFTDDTAAFARALNGTPAGDA